MRNELNELIFLMVDLKREAIYGYVNNWEDESRLMPGNRPELMQWGEGIDSFTARPSEALTASGLTPAIQSRGACAGKWGRGGFGEFDGTCSPWRLHFGGYHRSSPISVPFDLIEMLIYQYCDLMPHVRCTAWPQRHYIITKGVGSYVVSCPLPG